MKKPKKKRFTVILRSQTPMKIKEIIQSRRNQILVVLILVTLTVGIPLFIFFFSPPVQSSSVEISLIGAINTGGEARRVHVEDDLAFVIDIGDHESYGLIIVNVSNPFQPAIRGTYFDGGLPFSIESAGDIVYIADQLEGLRVLDISNSSQSTSIEGQYIGSGAAYDLEIVGDLLFLADGQYGLVILNISIPSTPVFISSYGNGFVHLDIEGNIAYLAGGERIRLVDISNPDHPTLIGQFFLSGITLWDPSVSNDIIYVAIHSGTRRELKILDTTNPTSVEQLSEFDSAGGFQSFYVQGSFLYAVDYERGLYLLDISNPLSPVEITRFFDGGLPWDVVLSDDLIFLCGTADLQILQMTYE